MLTKSRITSADGLTTTEKIDLSKASKDEWLALGGDGIGGFEWIIRDIEQYWLAEATPTQRTRHEAPPTTLGEWSTLPPPKEPRHQSKQWYAHQVLWRIRSIRGLLRKRRKSSRAELEAAVILGIRLGELHTSAFFRFNLGSVTRTGIRRHKASRAAGVKSGEARRRNRELIRSLAIEIRQTNPYDRRVYPTRRLALTIANRTGLHYGTVRESLRVMGRK